MAELVTLLALRWKFSYIFNHFVLTTQPDNIPPISKMTILSVRHHFIPYTDRFQRFISKNATVRG